MVKNWGHRALFVFVYYFGFIQIYHRKDVNKFDVMVAMQTATYVVVSTIRLIIDNWPLSFVENKQRLRKEKTWCQTLINSN